MPTATVDAHHHFWQLDRFDYAWLEPPALAPIRRDYGPEDLAPLLEAAGIDRSIFVQTRHDLEENRWALGLAKEHDFLAGVVGWVDLASEACEDQLAEFRPDPKFVGVRHVVQDEPDDDFLIRPDVMRGLAVLEKHGVPFDILIYPRHLPHVPTLARAFPGLPLVIDHLAKPAIKDHRVADWLAPFRDASAFPNVFCKLSGMTTEADWQSWTPDDLAPYVRVALDTFGPFRLIYGSDWPVSELAGTYARTREALDHALGPVTESEHAAIFGGNAARFYRLDMPPKAM